MANKNSTELTGELSQEICKNVSAGMPSRAAAALAGVDRTEFADWMHKAKKGVEPYLSLASDIDKAALATQRRVVATVTLAATRDAKIGMEFLSRRYPEDWSEHARERSVQLEAESRSLSETRELASRMTERFPLLHWESREDFETLAGALIGEHQPQGPTEEHLVEELAGIVQLRNRFRLGEAAAYRRGLADTVSSYSKTVHRALAHLGETEPVETVSDALTASSDDTAGLLAELREDERVACDVAQKLGAPEPISYEAALVVIGHRKAWWEEARVEDKLKADANGLRKYLEEKLLPFVSQRILEIESRPLILQQAFGESFDAKKIEHLRRIEAFLDRKFETTLDRLLHLRQLRLAKVS